MTAGGPRAGAGRKKSEPTVQYTIRLPIPLAENLKELGPKFVRA